MATAQEFRTVTDLPGEFPGGWMENYQRVEIFRYSGRKEAIYEMRYNHVSGQCLLFSAYSPLQGRGQFLALGPQSDGTFSNYPALEAVVKGE